MPEDQKKEIEKRLWVIANDIRGQMTLGNLRDYLLGLIFYKYLSDKIEIFADKVLETYKIKYHECGVTKDCKKYIDKIKKESIDEYGYYIEPSQLFKKIIEKGEQGGLILDDLKEIFNYIEKTTIGQSSNEDFRGLFDEINLDSRNLGDTPEKRNKFIVNAMKHLDAINFNLTKSENDILGDVYEYLIEKFASNVGTKAGEFYTPRAVSKIIAKITINETKKIKTVYDPTCGSGSLLLRVGAEMDKKIKRKVRFIGQEENRTTYNLARMNMIIHDIKYDRFDIQQGDTLEEPKHEKQFDIVVANPPYAQHWKSDTNPTFAVDDRFSRYGALAPKSKADLAFVQHMIHNLSDQGTLAVVLPLGVLSRGSAEEKIRKYMIEKENLIDAVIQLPANLFYGTSIPTCIIIIKKCRTDDKNILFINAEHDFEKTGNKNTLREEHIKKIVDGYIKRKSVNDFSKKVSIKEIIENDCNLSVTQYARKEEKQEKVDLNKLSKEMQKIEKDIQKTNTEIKKHCKKMKLNSPI